MILQISIETWLIDQNQKYELEWQLDNVWFKFFNSLVYL